MPSCSRTRRALPWTVIPDPTVVGSGLTSTSSTATPASARKMAVALPAAPPPTTRTLFTAGMSEDSRCSGNGSPDGDRVDRRADGAGHRQGGGGEEELVAAVGRAVLGQRVEVPQLAEEEADVRDGDLVQRL